MSSLKYQSKPGVTKNSCIVENKDTLFDYYTQFLVDEQVEQEMKTKRR